MVTWSSGTAAWIDRTDSPMRERIAADSRPRAVRSSVESAAVSRIAASTSPDSAETSWAEMV